MIRPSLVRRSRVVPPTQVLAFLVGIGASLLLGAILLGVSGHSPVEVYERMFDSAFMGTDSLSRTVERATPLALTGLAVAVAGSMGLWNIGAEGQMMAGATVATGVAMVADGLSGPVLIALMMASGVAGGMLLMVGPALARSHLRVSEIITTLMLVYVAIRVVEWLETGPWKDPNSLGFAVIEPVPEQASLPGLFGRANVGSLVALGCSLCSGWRSPVPHGGMNCDWPGRRPTPPGTPASPCAARFWLPCCCREASPVWRARYS